MAKVTTPAKRHSFFGGDRVKPQGLIIPESAVFLKNDCKAGCWAMGETELGSKLEFFILKFSKRISELNRPLA